MRQATQDRLREIDRHFYESHAEAFDRARDRPWPGMHEVAARLAARKREGSSSVRVLDLGCGNGRFVPALQEKLGERLEYLGLDASEPLLARARARHAGDHVRFERRDLLAAEAEGAVGEARYDLVAVIGVLHHIPSESARRALLLALARRLAPAGMLVFTLWRFDRSPRFAGRRLPEQRCAQLGIDADDLEPGDALLRFGGPEEAVRYAHFVDEAELARLLADLPLRPCARFLSDGEGSDQNEYVVLEAC